MDCHTIVDLLVGSSFFFPAAASNLGRSTIEITAGLMVPCMPSVAVVYRRYRHPISVYMSQSRLKLGNLITAIGSAYKHKPTGSTEELYSWNEVKLGTVKRSPSMTKYEETPGGTHRSEPLRDLEPMTSHIIKTTKIEVKTGAQAQKSTAST